MHARATPPTPKAPKRREATKAKIHDLVTTVILRAMLVFGEVEPAELTGILTCEGVGGTRTGGERRRLVLRPVLRDFFFEVSQSWRPAGAQLNK